MMRNVRCYIQIMSGKQPQKKKGVTPVVLIDESQELAKTLVINKGGNPKDYPSGVKSSSNAFVGGFKYRPQQAPKAKVEDNVSKLSPSQLEKFTVYDEFGIINNSIGKKKYRELPNQPQNSTPFQAQVPNISDQNPWKRPNKQPIQNNFLHPNYQQISDTNQRQQTAAHVQSSLEVINLENIEAKLQAHRQFLKPIQDQYNQIKGKTPVPIENRSREKLRFNIDVDKEFKQIQPQKVYELIKQKQDNMERSKEEVLLEELWEQKKRKDPKLAEYDFKYQQYLVEKEAKKMVGTVFKESLFTWDKYASHDDIEKRKQAKKHKSKEKVYGEQIQRKVIAKAHANPSLSPSKDPEHQSKPTQADLQQRIASKDDKFIGKYIMAEVDVDKRGTISKDELVQYLSSKDHLIKGYHIDLKWLHTDLDNFVTKRKGMLNQQEVIQFLATLESMRHPQLILKQVQAKPVKGNPLLEGKTSDGLITCYFQEHASRFQKIFSLIDVNDDRIIKRQEFLQSIYLDADCLKILDKPALKFNLIDKSITFRQILAYVLDDYRKQRNDKLKKSKQYITIERFREYFEIPESLDLKMFERSANDRLRRQKQSAEIEMFDLEQDYLLILKDIFATVPRVYQQYIVANDFISIALKDPQVLAISEELCRVQSHETGLSVETIRSTLMRMTKQCDEYVTWDSLKAYLSRRGRPLDWDYQLIQKKKQVRENKLKAGLDQAKNRLQKASPTKEGALQRGPIASDTIQSKAFKTNSIDKYTVPQPFNITDERRKSQLKTKELSSEQREIEEMKKQFKAKPVNKQILQPNPDLVRGKASKNEQKSSVYNYENYQNDRIERVLKKAQEQFEQSEMIKEIKRMSQVKAHTIKVDLNKKLDDVIEEQRKNKAKSKPKPTVPSVSSNLYPENPKEEGAKKLQKLKNKMEKQTEAQKMRQKLQEEIKNKAKQKNQQAKKAAQEQKKRQEEEKRQREKLDQGPSRPKINKHELSEEQKEAIRRNKEDKQRKIQEEYLKMLEIENNKKKKRLDYVKKQTKLDLAGLEDEQILNRLDQVDLEQLLLDERDKAAFRQEFNFKEKTRKEIKERFSGLAGRQRAAMEAEQKRLADQKRKLKQLKQEKVVNQKIEEAKEKKAQVNSTLNMDKEFHRSKALRRYRAIMEGKQPLSQYDAYSNIGEAGDDK